MARLGDVVHLHQHPDQDTPMPDRRITRVTLSDDSTVAEAWELTTEPCSWCGAAGAVWRDPAADTYRVCLGCRRGGEPGQAPHTPASNATFAAILGQLERAG